MKILFMMVLLLFTATAWATTPNEADFPALYEVINTNATRGFMIGHFCAMGLRDQANPGVAFVVLQHGLSCHVFDAGTVFHGRRVKNEIWLFVPNSGKPKVEHWPINDPVITK